MGSIKEPITELAREVRYEPVPGEVRGVIIAAWQRGGLLPASVVEWIVPQQPPLADPTYGNSNEQQANSVD